MTTTLNGYTLTDEVEHFDLPAIARLIQSTYWAADRTMDAITESLTSSTSLALTHAGVTVGIVRAISDHSVNSYICDFVIEESHRSQGLGTWMLEVLMSHPALVRTNQLLITRDAMAFYASHGFAQHPYVCMKRPRAISIPCP
jgi:GNAT superfamily N-acetyltransferase